MNSPDRPRNYGIISINDVEQKASFTVTGKLTPYTDKIALTAKTGLRDEGDFHRERPR